MAQDYNEKCGRRIVIGQTTSCFTASCNGWLVDSFAGKYWIRCCDTRHEQNKQVEEGKAASRSTTSTSR